MNGPFDLEHLVIRDLSGKEFHTTWETCNAGIFVKTPAPGGSYIVTGVMRDQIAWHFLILLN
jgi:hypothetical protein